MLNDVCAPSRKNDSFGFLLIIWARPGQRHNLKPIASCLSSLNVLAVGNTELWGTEFVLGPDDCSIDDIGPCSFSKNFRANCNATEAFLL